MGTIYQILPLNDSQEVAQTENAKKVCLVGCFFYGN